MGEASETLRRALAGHPLFEGFPESVIEALARAAREVRHRRGATIFIQGEEGSGLYLVLEGRVRISLTSAEGRESVLALLDPGQVFGEMALLDGRPRSADATVAEACRLLYVPRSALLDPLRDPEMAAGLIGVLCERLRATNGRLHALSCLDLPTRLARLLVGFAESYGESGADGVRLTLRLSQKDMGDMVAGSRERVNRLLGQWSRDGLLDRSAGRLVIHDLPGLKDIAQADLDDIL